METKTAPPQSEPEAEVISVRDEIARPKATKPPSGSIPVTRGGPHTTRDPGKPKKARLAYIPPASSLSHGPTPSTLGTVGPRPMPGQGPGVLGQIPGKPLVIPLPRPPRFDCGEDPDPFFKYWASLKPEELDRTLVYVYRNWPVWDPVMLLSFEEQERVQRKELRVTTNISKLTKPFDPKHWSSEIYHQFGSGDYHFKLNDIALRKTVCMVNIRGLRNLDDYPPVIDKRAVVLTDPANASYISRMRLKGVKFPGDPGESTEEQEDDMASNDALKQMTGTVERLTDRLVDINKQPPPAPVHDAKAQADIRAVEAVADGARRGIEIMGEAVKQAQSTQTQAQDPKSYLKDVLEMANVIGGGNKGQGDLVTMFQTMMAQQQSMFTLMIAELKDRLATAEKSASEARNASMAMLQTSLHTAQHPPQPAQPNPAQAQPAGPVVHERPADLLSQFERIMMLKQRFDEMGGGGDSNPTWMTFASEALKILATAGTNIAHNIAAAKAGTVPIAPPDLDAGGGQGEEEVPEPQPRGMNQMPGPGQTQQPQGGGGMNPVQFIQQLHAPLIKALNEGVPGYEFAARIILLQGAGTYAQMASLGKDQLMQFLQMYGPLWQDVIRFGAQFDQFLTDFLDQEQALQTAEDMRTGNLQPAQPPPAPRPMPTQSRPKTEKPRTVVQPDGSRVEVLPPTQSPGAGPMGPSRGPTVNAKPQKGPEPPPAA